MDLYVNNCEVLETSFLFDIGFNITLYSGCKVTGLVLRGIFLLRKKEIDWFYEGGAAAIYPDGEFHNEFFFALVNIL